MNPGAIVFDHRGLTVRARRSGRAFTGEILNERGDVHDVFWYTREVFPGAVIGGLRCPDLAFTTALAARMWIHTDGDGMT